jgi:hypothetical protein
MFTVLVVHKRTGPGLYPIKEEAVTLANKSFFKFDKNECLVSDCYTYCIPGIYNGTSESPV